MEELILWAHACLLAAIRLSLGLAMTPLFSAFGVPMMARLIVVLSIAALVASSMPIIPLSHGDWGFDYLLPAIGREASLGILLSIGVHAAFAAFAIAGRLADMQMGFTLGAVLDPVSKGHAAVFSSGFSVLAVLLFFVSDAHYLLLAGFFRAFEVMPLGRQFSIDGWMPVALEAGAMFSLGFSIGAPVVIALLLADVTVAVVSRNLPQMNIMFLSIPLKGLLGLAVMAGSLRLMAPVMHKALTLPLTLLNKV